MVALAYVHQLLLGVVLSAAALPVAVGLVHSFELLLAVVSIRLVLQVQRAAVAALWRIHREGASLFTDKITEYFYTHPETHHSRVASELLLPGLPEWNARYGWKPIMLN